MKGSTWCLIRWPGERYARAWRFCAPATGRFIDISNLYTQDLKVHYPEKRHFAIHLWPGAHPPAAISVNLDRNRSRIRGGVYPPIPFRPYPMARVSEAFKTMRKGLHIGKIVLIPAEPGRVETGIRAA